MLKTDKSGGVARIARRSSAEIIDEIHGRSYDLCGIAAVVDKLADCQPPGSWGEVIFHLRNSLNETSRGLAREIEALRDLEGEPC